MRTGGSYLDYLGRKDVNKQVENDIRILTKRSKKRGSKVAAPEVQETVDSYERAMDTSKYDAILSELIS